MFNFTEQEPRELYWRVSLYLRVRLKHESKTEPLAASLRQPFRHPDVVIVAAHELMHEVFFAVALKTP